MPNHFGATSASRYGFKSTSKHMQTKRGVSTQLHVAKQNSLNSTLPLSSTDLPLNLTTIGIDGLIKSDSRPCSCAGPYGVPNLIKIKLEAQIIFTTLQL